MILSDKLYSELTNLENEIHTVRQNKAVNDLQMEGFLKILEKSIEYCSVSACHVSDFLCTVQRKRSYGDRPVCGENVALVPDPGCGAGDFLCLCGRIYDLVSSQCHAG